MLGTLESLAHHNITGNGKCDGLKSARMRQSAAKYPRKGKRSTTIMGASFEMKV